MTTNTYRTDSADWTIPAGPCSFRADGADGAAHRAEEHARRLDRIANDWRGASACEAEVARLADQRAKGRTGPDAARGAAEAAYQEMKAVRANEWRGPPR